MHESVGPDVIHPRVLRELPDVTVSLLLVTYKQTW